MAYHGTMLISRARVHEVWSQMDPPGVLEGWLVWVRCHSSVIPRLSHFREWGLWFLVRVLYTQKVYVINISIKYPIIHCLFFGFTKFIPARECKVRSTNYSAHMQTQIKTETQTHIRTHTHTHIHTGTHARTQKKSINMGLLYNNSIYIYINFWM